MGNNYNTQTEKERKLEGGIKENKIATILAGLVGVGVVGVGALSGCLGGVDKDVGDDNMSKITYCTYNINETLETASETQQYLEEIIKECNGSEINIGEKTYTLKKLDNLSKTLKHKLTDLEQIEGDLNKYLKDNNLTNEYNENRLDSNDSRSYKIFDKVIERGYILADITDIIKGFGHINISQSYIKGKGTDYNAVSITSNKDISQLNNNVSQNYSGDTNNNNTIYNISNNGTSNIISIEDLIKSGFNVTEKTWVGPNNKNITGYLVSFTDIKKGKKTIAYVKNDKKSILTFEQGYLVPTEPMLGFPDGIETKDKEGGNTLVFSPVIEEYGGIPPLTYCYSSGSCKTDPDKTPDKITLDNTEFGNETTGYQGPPDKNNVDINNSNREGGITL